MVTNRSAARFAQVRQDELNVIKSQRLNRGDNRQGEEVEQLSGLAISGGGIRSASFALGVLQGLNKHNILRKVDYLSSVSGGGFIGSSLTWFNYLNKRDGLPWTFPFASENDQRHGESTSSPFNFLRYTGDYDLSFRSMVVIVLRNMVLAVSVYSAAMLLIFYNSTRLYVPNPWFLPFMSGWPAVSFFTQIVLLMISLFVITSFLYAGMTCLKSGADERGYRERYWFQRAQDRIIFIAFGVGVLALLPVIIHVVQAFVVENPNLINYTSASVATLSGVIGSVFEFFHNLKEYEADNNVLTKIRILVTSLLLIIGILLVNYMIALDWRQSTIPWLYWGVIFCVILTGWLVNLNLFGIGRICRDRLMEVFMPNLQAVRNNCWELATQANETYFSEVSGPDQWGPYHIINTNVVLAGSSNAKYQGRAGDNFIMSHLYCGGDAIGYYPMSTLSGGKMTLATAMFISGAAFNSKSGQGINRNWLVSFLNIHLSYWVQNPAVTGWRKVLSDMNKRPNFFYPGFFQGLLRKELKENAGYLELTDGSYFDNTGLYELIRRRVDTIYFSSAGDDPCFTLGDIGSVLVRIRVDFGVTVAFNDELESLMPGSDRGGDYGRRFGFSILGFNKGAIQYPASGSEPAKQGTLYIVQATLVKDLPSWIYSYRAEHAEFPNQPTNDQLFDETQVEAYRELGFRLTTQMCATLSLA